MTRSAFCVCRRVLTAVAMCFSVSAAQADDRAVSEPDVSAIGEAEAAAACNNGALSGAVFGGGAIKRYKLTLINGYTEYNTSTCAANGPGSWRVNSKDKCDGKACGDVTFGVLRNLPLSNGACPGRKYDFGAICYTWIRHDNHKIDDRVDATWVPPTLSDYNLPFSVDVPIVYPDRETTKHVGWDARGPGMWMQTLSNSKDPSFDWSKSDVEEADAGGVKSNDTCWCRGSKFKPFFAITGGRWPVQANGDWGADYVGWFFGPVDYYRQKQRAPCGTSFPQQMSFEATNVSGPLTKYASVNTLASSFNYQNYISGRAGKSKSRPFRAVASASRLSCSAISWPDQPKDEPATFGQKATVNDARPVAAAIDEIVRISGVPVTYEDASALDRRWSTSMVRGASENPRLNVPKGGKLTFSLPKDRSAESVKTALQDLLSVYDAQGGPVAFVLQQDALLHVVPQSTSGTKPAPLDARISLDVQPRSAMQAVSEISAALSSVLGRRVDVGTVPVSALQNRQTRLGARDEPARNVLTRLVVETGEPLAWQLFYDPGTDDFALNMDLVK